MLSANEIDKLAALLNHLHICLGLKFALMDDQAAEVFSSSEQADFCRAVKEAPTGRERCVAYDRQVIAEVRCTQKMKVYRCHCGLIEVAMPVMENGQAVATILFGQFLDEADHRAQWRETRRLLAWRRDADALSDAFFRLRQFSAAQIFSLTEIIRACICDVRLQGMLSASQMSDASRLQSYILQHFAEPITLHTLCAQMHMGKSKLFDLCRREFHATPGQMLLQARMDAAQRLLCTSSYDLTQIARMAGIPDTHYFCKRFKAFFGETPAAYRARMQSARK